MAPTRPLLVAASVLLLAGCGDSADPAAPERALREAPPPSAAPAPRAVRVRTTATLQLRGSVRLLNRRRAAGRVELVGTTAEGVELRGQGRLRLSGRLVREPDGSMAFAVRRARLAFRGTADGEPTRGHARQIDFGGPLGVVVQDASPSELLMAPGPVQADLSFVD